MDAMFSNAIFREDNDSHSEATMEDFLSLTEHPGDAFDCYQMHLTQRDSYSDYNLEPPLYYYHHHQQTVSLDTTKPALTSDQVSRDFENQMERVLQNLNSDDTDTWNMDTSGCLNTQQRMFLDYQHPLNHHISTQPQYERHDPLPHDSDTRNLQYSDDTDLMNSSSSHLVSSLQYSVKEMEGVFVACHQLPSLLSDTTTSHQATACCSITMAHPDPYILELIEQPALNHYNSVFNYSSTSMVEQSCHAMRRDRSAASYSPEEPHHVSPRSIFIDQEEQESRDSLCLLPQDVIVKPLLSQDDPLCDKLREYTKDSAKEKLLEIVAASNLDAAFLQSVVDCYITDPEETIIMFQTPKLAQKSYGTEKRFLTPPPSVTVFGKFRTPDMDSTGFPWNMSHSTISNDYSDLPHHFNSNLTLAATVVNESEDSQRAARSSRHQLTTRYLSMESESCTETTATQILDLPTDLHFRQGEIQVDAAVKVVFKQMFVQDGDRKKRFAIQLSARNKSQKTFASFMSKPLKVISKPSKRKQCTTQELSLYSGDTISLFNRVRSQTISTKFLAVDSSQDEFTANQMSWDSFIIQHLNDYLDDYIESSLSAATPIEASPPISPPLSGDAIMTGVLDNYNDRPPVCCGDEVILIDSRTGLTTVPLIVRKVEDKSLVTIPDTSLDFKTFIPDESKLPGAPDIYMNEGQLMELLTERRSQPRRRTNTNLDGGEQITQLHRIAFQIEGSKTFLGLFEDKIIRPTLPVTHRLNHWQEYATGRNGCEFKGKNGRKQHVKRSKLIIDVTEFGVWTVVGVDVENYRFWTPRMSYFQRQRTNPKTIAGLLSPMNAPCDIVLGHVPTISSVIFSADGSICIKGNNFGANFWVWFRDIPARKCKTYHKSSITVEIPDTMKNVTKNAMIVKSELIKVLDTDGDGYPILLVRGDGFVFNTQCKLLLR